MKVEDYQEGVRAYHRCVSFESEHFEAWNNLAACYVNLGQKERAQKVLKVNISLLMNYFNYTIIGKFEVEPRELERVAKSNFDIGGHQRF